MAGALLASLPAVAEKPETEMRGEGKAKVFVFPGENASYLGIDSTDITADRVGPLKLKEERGVEVIMVDQDAPAGKAGLKEHDVILDFNGTRVEGVEHLRRLIHEIPPGRTVTLGISRDGQPMTLKAQLADRAKAVQMARPAVRPNIVIPPIEMPDMPDINVNMAVIGYSRAGLVVENLTPQLGEFFGVRNGQGVLVRSVEKGTPAETAGLKAGDVIVRVEKDRIDDRGDWKLALRSYAGSKVTLGVIRDKREQNVTITLPGRKTSDSSWDFDWQGFEDMEFWPFESKFLNLRKIHAQTIADLSTAMRARQQELRREMDHARQQIRLQQQQLRREMERTKREIKRTLLMD
jgi:C-terminal processing protease CtpA/Prc